MDSLSTPCIFCGTDRPIASEVCPTCGREWIDEHIPQLGAPAPPAPPAATPAATPPAPPVAPSQDAAEQMPVANEPSPASPDQPSDQSQSVESPPPAAAPVAAAAGASLAFSDSGDTGFDDAAGTQADEALLSHEPAAEPPESAPSAKTSTDVSAPPEEATSIFAAPVVPETPNASPRDGGAPVEPPSPAEPAAVQPLTDPPAVERGLEDSTPESGESVDMTPADPDELGIIPVVQAQGPPEYLPEPLEAEPQPPSDQTQPAPPAFASSIESDVPESTAPEHAEQLGPVPIVPPPNPVAATPATHAETPDAPETAAAGVVGDEAAEPPVDAAPPAPQRQPAAGVTAATGGSIDPDSLIEDVFSDDLVDGRPPLASDDMLDDESAWSEFALGGAAASRSPEVEPPSEPPAAVPSTHPMPSETAPQPTTPAQPPGEPLPATEPLPAGAATAATAAGDAGEFGGQHPDESDFFAAPMADGAGHSTSRSKGIEAPSRNRWSQTAVVAVIVIGIVAAWFVVLTLITRDSADDDPTVASDPDVTAPASTAAPETTIASTTSAPTTTLAPSTTVPTIEAVGDPIPLADLQLGAFALGPIDFGDTDGLGRLVASLDQPDTIADAGGEQGLCPDETGFTAHWGPLSAIFIGSTETNLLVGYQLGNDPSHPTSELTTLSGLQVGDTVAELESIYASFEISYEEIDGQPNFILVRQSDSATLLWGPVTSSETDGIVEGIYSPRACDAGPTPST